MKHREIVITPQAAEPSALLSGPAPPCHQRVALRNTLIALATSLVSLVQVAAEDDPWARFRSYRQQLGSLAGDPEGLAELRREILAGETALGVLLSLPGSDPAGAEDYYRRAVALAEQTDDKVRSAESFGDRIDVVQAYAGFLAEQDRDREAERWLGRCLREVESRVDAWSQLTAEDPRHQAVASLRAARLPSLLRAVAATAAATGKAEVGLAYLDRADRLASPASREEAYPVLVTRSRLLQALGRQEEALSTLTEALAIRLDPEVVGPMRQMAAALAASESSLLARARELRAAAAFDFPTFRLRDAGSGEPVTFADVRGKATLFNVFFPSCGFCNAEMPHLKEIEQTYADRGFKLVSVNLLPDQDEMIPGWKEQGGYRHPILVTESTDYLLETFGLKFPGGMPANFLIGADGKVHFKHIGYRKGEEVVIESQVRELLGLPPFTS